jgi:hypothetical protein
VLKRRYTSIRADDLSSRDEFSSRMSGGKKSPAADFDEVLAWTKQVNSTPSSSINELLGIEVIIPLYIFGCVSRQLWRIPCCHSHSIS